MKTYTVLGSVDVLISKRVKANSEDEARAKARKLFGGIQECAGNGGLYKIICVDKVGESIYPTDSEVEWNDAWEENPNEIWE